MINYEKEILDFLGLPSIPKKRWDGVTPFDKGVAVIKQTGQQSAYAACSYNPEKGDKNVTITKVFGIEPFSRIEDVFIVPSYMNNIDEIPKMDLDDESKKKAETILQEATELENNGVVDDVLTNPVNEYYFDNITNDDEARAFIKAYNKRNKIKGKIPKTHEKIIMRLAVIYSESNGK